MTNSPTTWTIRADQRLLDATPHDARERHGYHPERYGLTTRVYIVEEQHMLWPREYDGALQFGGHFMAGDIAASKAALIARLTLMGAMAEASPIICLDIESTPYRWAELERGHPLAAAAFREWYVTTQLTAPIEYRWESACLAWHRVMILEVLRVKPRARVGFYNAPWAHLVTTEPGVFDAFYSPCTAFFPECDGVPYEEVVRRCRHARQVAVARFVCPLVSPGVVASRSDWCLSTGANAVGVWFDGQLDEYEAEMSEELVAPFARWPIVEAKPAGAEGMTP